MQQDSSQDQHSTKTSRIQIEEKGDPRVYMAAERTFLAWIRTGVALMGFGFIVARFGLFLRELTLIDKVSPPNGTRFSLPIGIALIVLGIVTTIVAGVRHCRYIRAIDQGQFRAAFGSAFAFSIAALLAVIGLGMAIYLTRI
jgi:putative membrane protein